MIRLTAVAPPSATLFGQAPVRSLAATETSPAPPPDDSSVALSVPPATVGGCS